MTRESKYDRHEVINKLAGRGLIPKHYKGTSTLSHFEVPPYVGVGIKFLGMIDFLRVPLVRKKYYKNDRHSYLDKPRSPKVIMNQDRAYLYAWFGVREEAERWVELQKKNPRLGFTVQKTEVYQTESLEYRACLEGMR